MVCTGTKNCTIKSYHSKSTRENYSLFTWDVIEILVNSIYRKNSVHEWSHRKKVNIKNH